MSGAGFTTKSFVYFGDQWDDFWRRRQQIAFRLAEYEDVATMLYVELPLTLATLARYRQGAVSSVVAAQCRRVLRHGTVLHLSEAWS